MNRLVPLLVLVAVVVAACNGRDSKGDPWETVIEVGTVDVVPRIVSNELIVGQNRFVFGLLDAQNTAITDAAVELRFFDLERSRTEAVTSVAAQPISTPEAVEAYRWLYVAPVTFPRAGLWGAEVQVTRSGGTVSIARVRFSVFAETATIDMGEPALPTDNLTLATVGGDIRNRELTTDAEPDPAFYEQTVTEAIRAGRPFVLVFATPAFCVTRTCAPMLDVVKSVRPEFTGRVTFIHIEIADVEASTKTGTLVYKRVFDEWSLPSEPWTFVFGRDGRLLAKFEGVLLASELQMVLTEALAD